jgi:hypothetical protein
VPADVSRNDRNDENIEMEKDQCMGKSNESNLSKTQGKQKAKGKKPTTPSTSRVSIDKRIV